jgi:glycogen debranching enzyme
MRRVRRLVLFLLSLSFSLLAYSQTAALKSISSLFDNAEEITGKQEHLATPYITAGDKLYMVGNQDGSFPDIGWHVKGEMGGIWHHPIKLMDGFVERVSFDHEDYDLKRADAFVNYPFGNKHIYARFSEKVSLERYQFVPDGIGAIQIEFVFRNRTRRTLAIHFRLEAITNLMPVWLGDRTGMFDGKDSARFDPGNNVWVAKDDLNPWYVVYGSSVKGVPDSTVTAKPDKPNTAITGTEYIFEIKPDGVFTFPFVIAGSCKSKEEAVRSYSNVSENAYALLSRKKARLGAINDHAQLTLNDKDVERTFRWLKYNTDWLTLDVDGFGRSLCAGLPDYPFFFGCDMSYALKGLICTGQRDIVYSTIDLLNRVSEKTNGNGRIIHEVSTNGAVNNPGNVGETPQFISLLWDVFRWTGDMAFLEKYFPTVERGLNWLLVSCDPDTDLIPDGNGMMEISGLNSEMIDVAAYTQKALADAATMAGILGRDSLSREYHRKASLLKNKINSEFWAADYGSYADFMSTRSQALTLVDDAVTRAGTLKNIWALAELKSIKVKIESDSSEATRGFVVFHNWVVNTPMETGIADPEKAVRALKTAGKFTSPYGMFVTGIDWNKQAGNNEGSYAATTRMNDFTYTGTVMTLPTGVQVIAEGNYGRAEEAYRLLRKVSRTFSYALPGSMYEVSPDYGMMTQAWNIYGVGKSIVEQFLGLKPLAYKKEITVSPMLPSAWTNGKIENVEIGDNEMTLSFSQKPRGDSFEILQKYNTWTVIFKQPRGKYAEWIVNGKRTKPNVIGDVEQVKVLGKKNKLELVK